MQKVRFCYHYIDLAVPHTLTTASLTHAVNSALHHFGSYIIQNLPALSHKVPVSGISSHFKHPQKGCQLPNKYLSVSLWSPGRIRWFKHVINLNYFRMSRIAPYVSHFLTLVPVKEAKEDEFSWSHLCKQLLYKKSCCLSFFKRILTLFRISDKTWNMI